MDNGSLLVFLTAFSLSKPYIKTEPKYSAAVDESTKAAQIQLGLDAKYKDAQTYFTAQAKKKADEYGITPVGYLAAPALVYYREKKLHNSIHLLGIKAETSLSNNSAELKVIIPFDKVF